MRLWRRRKSGESDVFRPLSEEEKEFVEHDVDERLKSDEAPAAATPGSSINVDDISGLDLPLSQGERKFVEREVDEQLGHNEPGADGESRR